MPRSIRLFAFGISASLIVGALVFGSKLTDARWLAVLGLAWILFMVSLWVPIPVVVPTERRTVIRTAATLAAGFVALSVQLLRLQVVKGEDNANRVGISPEGEPISNVRRVNLGLDIRRGRILATSGEVLAGTEEIDEGWGRTYPQPAAASLLGYYSPLQYGISGLEQAFDAELTGKETDNPFLELRDDLLHRARQGSDVVLTIDLGLQQVAVDALGDRPGAAVLLEVETGRVLAMVSNPSADPARIFAANNEQTDVTAEYWDALLEGDARPLVSRSTQGLYTPGSIFKVVTASAAVDLGHANPQTMYLDDGVLNLPGRQIIENNRPDETISTWSLEDSLAWSLNVVYAQVGLEVGAPEMRDYAEAFGFGADIPFPTEVARSQLEGQDGFLNSPPALAETSFGQGQLLVTPLHMALIAAGIANGGRLMRPQILDRVVAPDGKVVREGETGEWRTATRPETAATVADMMRHAVEIGVATGAYVDGLSVGGKTGTAEVADKDPHAWFMGFAGTFEDPSPRHAIAVVLENGGSGSIDIARQIMVAAGER